MAENSQPASEMPTDKAECGDLDKYGFRKKRQSLRDVVLPRSFSDSTSDDSDDTGASLQLQRKQMKKDLRKLQRCMSRTGVAALAASVIGSPIDGVSCMDQASRFRKQHKRLIPELYPQLHTDEQPDFGALAAFGQSKLYAGESGLTEGALKELSLSELSNIAPGLTLTEWDRVSEVGSEMGRQTEHETKGADGSTILSKRQGPVASEPHGRCVKESKLSREGYIDFMACLDFVEVVTDVKANRGQGLPEPPMERVMSMRSLDDVNIEQTQLEHQKEVDMSTSAPFKGLPGADTAGLLVLAKQAVKNAVTQPVKQISARCRDAVSAFASFLGEPPQRPAGPGNFGSPTDVWLAMQRIRRGNADEQHEAKMFLFCTMAFLVAFVLNFLALSLIVLAFQGIPDVQQVQEVDTGLLDATGSPKSISKVLTVVMISLLAGSGLAISHPMFDAILSGT